MSMRKLLEIRSLSDIEPLETRIQVAADLAARRPRELTTGSNDGLVVLRRLKFEPFGRHPLEDRDLNRRSLGSGDCP